MSEQSPSPASPPSDLGASLRITGPMPCVKCLYNLDGLPHDHKCPECGTEVLQTLHSPAAAALSDLIRLRRGLMMIAIAMIGGTLWLAIGQAAVLMFSFGGMWGTSVPSTIIFTLVPAGSVLFTLISAIGWARICSAIAALQPEQTHSAKVVRWLATIYTAFYTAAALGVFAMEVFGLHSLESAAFGIGIVGIALVAWTVRTALGFGLLAAIARACSARNTARTIRVFVWCAASLPVFIVGCIIGVEVFDLESFAGFYIEYAMGISTLLLAAAIISLGILALVVRRMLAPFYKAARSRKLTAS